MTDHLKAVCIRLTSDNLGQLTHHWLFFCSKLSLSYQPLKDPHVYMEYAAITVCMHAEYPDWKNSKYPSTHLVKSQAKRNLYN